MDPLHHPIAQLYSLSPLGIAGYLLPGIFLSQYDAVVRNPPPFIRLLNWLRRRFGERALISHAAKIPSMSASQ